MRQATTRMMAVGAACGAAWWPWSPALGAEKITIADLAPRGSLLVAGIDDSKAMLDAFDRTGFKSLWDEPAVQAWYKKHSQEQLEHLSGALGDLGVKAEDLKRPTGPVGVAIWMPESAGKAPRAAGAAGQAPVVLAIADFGENAESMGTTITDAFERAERQKKLEVKEKDHDGVTVYTLKPTGADPKAAEDADDDEGAVGGLLPGGIDTIYYARAGNNLLACSDEAGLERALDRIGGDHMAGIGDDADFTAARAQLGKTQGYAVLLMGPGLRWLKDSADQAGEDGMGPVVMGMLAPLGLADIKAVSAGIRFDADEGMMEQRFAVLAPKKAGLLALLDTPAGRFEPPAFVGADAASATMFQFNFAGILPLVNQVVSNLPQDQKEQAGPMVMGVTATFGPVLANLGPEVFIVGQYERPFSPESQKQVIALRARDAQALGQALQGLLPMWGFSGRDFQGNQIWSPGEGGMIPAGSVAMGLGLGYVFVGPTTSVENAMRQGGAADGPRLAAEERFTTAAHGISGAGIGFNYTDVKMLCDWYDWYVHNIEAITKSQIEKSFGNEAPGDDQERQWRKDAMEHAMKAIPAWLNDLPPVSLVSKHLGDSVSEFKATPEGFSGRGLLLRPKK